MKFFSRKHFLWGMVIGIVLLFSFLFSLPDGKLHLIFCNVGQGDAVYLRTPVGQDVLIDGGPNDQVLSCLGKHLPFYDRAIDLVILSHPQKDHLSGLISVLKRYSVKYIVMGVEGNEAKEYQELVRLIAEKKIPVKHLYQGDNLSLGEVKLKVVWPTKVWAEQNLSLADDPSILSNPQILGLATKQDLNEFSYYLHLQYGSFDALLTGDGDDKIQEKILKSGDLMEVEILKVPHHGSKHALLPEFLDEIKPAIAIISMGKNSFGHPAQELIDLLTSRSIQYQRTDRAGNIEIISDGKTWKSH